MVFTCVLAIAAVLAGGGTAGRFAGRIVNRVELVPEGGSVPDKAQSLVEVKPGDRLDLVAVRRSIKQLFALGGFSDIKVEAQPEQEGVALTFRLYPVPVVEQIAFLGLGKDSGKLRSRLASLSREAAIEPGSVFDMDKVEWAAARIPERLEAAGFLWGRGAPEVRFQGPRATVVFHVEPGPKARVGGIRIHGAEGPAAADFLRRTRLKPGMPYSRAGLEESVERAVSRWKRVGYYQARADIRETPDPPDHVGIDLDVDIGPRVRVEVEGAEISPRNLAGIVPILRELSVSEDLIEESRANLEERLHEQGYRDAVVTVERETQPGSLLLRFRVDAGQQFRIGEVRLQGLATLAPGQVLALMRTRPGRFHATPFRAQIWEEDLKEIRGYLLLLGFHRAVAEGEVKERAEPRGVVDLVVHVTEGPRALIGALEVDGAARIPSAEVVSACGLVVGAPFHVSQVAEAREKVVSLYRNRGFQESDVGVRTEFNESGTVAVVGFSIREGAETRIDRVILSGLEVTREEALRREVRLAPDAPLSMDAVLETRQQLLGTGLFSTVDVEVLPKDPASGASDVLIGVKEGPRTSFGWGFGYNERELARVEAEVSRRNLFGLNRTASIFGRASIRGGRFIATYRQPEFLGLALPVFFTAIWEEQDRTSFDFIRRGVGFQVSKKLSESRTMFFRYNFDRTDVFRLEIAPEELPRQFRSIRLSRVSVSQVTDTRDDPINPARGQLRLLDLELSAKLLGSKSPFVKGLAQQFFYWPLPHGTVGVVGLRLGVAQTFRPDRDALLPITERFFAGGANTLRGFGLDEASPKDPFGNPVGGNVLTLVNLELRFPIVRKLGGVFFSDNGTVYRRLSVIELLNWRYNLGFGFRYGTPLGPLRVDWGFKVDRRPEEARSRVHVSLGHAF